MRTVELQADLAGVDDNLARGPANLAARPRSGVLAGQLLLLRYRETVPRLPHATAHADQQTPHGRAWPAQPGMAARAAAARGPLTAAEAAGQMQPAVARLRSRRHSRQVPPPPCRQRRRACHLGKQRSRLHVRPTQPRVSSRHPPAPRPCALVPLPGNMMGHRLVPTATDDNLHPPTVAC